MRYQTNWTFGPFLAVSAPVAAGKDQMCSNFNTITRQMFVPTRQCFSSSSHSNGPTFSSFLVRSLRRCARKKCSCIFSHWKAHFAIRIVQLIFFFLRENQKNLLFSLPSQRHNQQQCAGCTPDYLQNRRKNTKSDRKSPRDVVLLVVDQLLVALRPVAFSARCAASFR